MTVRLSPLRIALEALFSNCEWYTARQLVGHVGYLVSLAQASRYFINSVSQGRTRAEAEAIFYRDEVHAIEMGKRLVITERCADIGCETQNVGQGWDREYRLTPERLAEIQEKRSNIGAKELQVKPPGKHRSRSGT